MKHDRVAYGLVIPSAVFFLLFTALPFCLVAALSLQKTNYIVSEFVGLKNYLVMFKDPVFTKTIGNSFLYALYIVPLQIGIPLFVVLLIYDMEKWIHNVVRFLFYIPVFASGIIIASVWRWIFHPVQGLANAALSLIGLGPVMWLANRYTAIGVISLILVTTSMGFYILVYLATILTIPKELFDAARLDGATKNQIKLHIIIPMIMPTLLFMILIVFIATFQIWELIYMLTNGGPNHGTESMLFNIYTTGILMSRYGMASAKSIILLLIVLAISIIKKRLERRLER